MVWSPSAEVSCALRGRRYSGWLLAIAMLSVLLAAPSTQAAPEVGAVEQPIVDVRPMGPGQLLALSYWPFAAHHGAGTPGLLRVDVDAQIRPEGCGPLTWSTHPVRASNAAGPFCVGVLRGTATPLLVVGRPGGAPYILVPTELEVSVGADGARVVRLGQPGTPLPGVAEAIRRWASAPEGRR